MRHVFRWMGQIRVNLTEQRKKHFVENHPEHFNVILRFTIINEKRSVLVCRVSDWNDMSDCASRENWIMRLKHLGLEDMSSTRSGLAATLGKLFFSLCPNSPITWTQKLHHFNQMTNLWHDGRAGVCLKPSSICLVWMRVQGYLIASSG